jgi:indolepyruvate decarboxylase
MEYSHSNVISARYDRIYIKNHLYENVNMRDFLIGLTERITKRDYKTFNLTTAAQGCTHRKTAPYLPVVVSQDLSLRRFWDRMSHFIPENAIVMADTGVSLWAAAETMLPPGADFIGQIFYGSIGYTVGACLGAALAAPERRVLLFIGDGSFQVTCQDISTMIRFKTNPIVFLINNDGYTIERLILDGSFNDIQPWKYWMIPQAFGGSKGWDVKREGELEIALDSIHFDINKSSFAFLEIHLPRWDYTESLKRATEGMKLKNEEAEVTA